MAIFFADDGIGRSIQRCFLDERGCGAWQEVTRLANRVNIPAVEKRTDMPPATGWLVGSGSIDLLKTDDEGHVIANDDGRPMPIRHYGIIKLIWGQDA